MLPLTAAEIQALVAAALAEDIGPGDVTTDACVPATRQARARLVARTPLVLCGRAFAEAAFRAMDPHLDLDLHAADGDAVPAGGLVLEVAGAARAILTAERVALNFLQRLSGIATLTRRFVDAVAGTRARLLDTRKTTPGWRRLEKYAVACGGGVNHRFGLGDLVLIKDNHLAALAGERPDPIAAAVARARAARPYLRVEVEADTLAQVEQALAAGADIILLDNLPPEALREAVRLAAGRALLEASGGVTLATVRAIAETGVDYISVGALTHSAPAADLGLDFVA
ncbi:MAG TPA: carboxylating nicotinate-nucleotide diphosphorylase [Verrucomicrobiota bacterium]|nr:carboxylating nicotinate-nucleotide diphosphorylase [Verrucomicrobiota bacterium]